MFPPLAPTTIIASSTLECAAILACYKDHQMATWLTVEHANRSRDNKYSSVLLAMFLGKPRNALKSIPKTTSIRDIHKRDPTPTNLSSMHDPKTWRIANNPARVNEIIERLETKALFPITLVYSLAAFP
jgi:hypothetical protein